MLSEESVGLSVYPPIVTRQQLGKDIPQERRFLNLSFSMRFLSYQEKVSDKFFPQLIVLVSNPSTVKYDYPEKDGHKKRRVIFFCQLFLTMIYNVK
jgi:hypothetical protein